jgi:hypothetical protein
MPSPITAPCQQDHGDRGFIPETAVALAWTGHGILWVPVYGAAFVSSLALSCKSGLDRAVASLGPSGLPEDG